jgi:hypothetical protein
VTKSIDRQAGTAQGPPLGPVGVQVAGSVVSVTVGHVFNVVVDVDSVDDDGGGGSVTVVGQAGTTTVRYCVSAQ